MSDTGTADCDLRVLREPETLLDEAGVRLSHGGLLATPAGLVTVLALERRPLPGPVFDSTPPWLAYLTVPGRRDALLALPGIFDDAEHGVQFVVLSFGPVPDPRGQVMAVHHPDLPRSLGLFLDSPAAPSLSTGWLAAPGVLTPPAPRPAQVWHTGLLHVAGLLFTHLEATLDHPDLLTAPDWDYTPHRPEGTPQPLQAHFPHGAHHRSGSASAGPGHAVYDAILTTPDTPTPFTWTCHPLGLTTARTAQPPQDRA